MEEEDQGAMEFDMDVSLTQTLKRKRKTISKNKVAPAQTDGPTEATLDSEPDAAEHLTGNAPPKIALSEFDYSVENHFKALDTIAKLCLHPEKLDADQAKIKRFSNSITFLREWSDFNYAPRVVKFACQYDSKQKDVIGGVTLPQFSAASVPKKKTQNGSGAGTESSKDFVMHVGGAVWALDWCPRVDLNTENHIKSEFIAVAAHPPESSYNKIGAPLTGRGAIQIWCLLNVYAKEDIPSKGNNKPKPTSQKKITVKSDEPHKLPRPRGRPRKKPLNDPVEKKDTDKLPKPRGRPRKKPLNDPVEMKDTDAQYAQPLAIEFPVGPPRLHSSDRSSGNSTKLVCDEDSVRTHNDCSQIEHANALLMTDPKGRGNKAKAQKEGQVHDNSLHIPKQCEHRESTFVNPLASTSFSLDSLNPDKNKNCIRSCDANTSKNSIPVDVALPRMILCLAHNGKVAWDVKWQPVNDYDPLSMDIMGYLAVLLGNGALEVWEVPLPHTMKLVYPACQERIDPRFIKLQPVFKCSMLKCGDRQSIPLTVEWSVSAPHDMILAGCHDGVVALWKFSVTDSLTETRPLLCFSADTGPIRTLAWAPIQSDLESANVIVTAGHRGFKFWDIRDPFRPLWDHPTQGGTYGLAWLQDPRCVFGSIDDGTLWLLPLEKGAPDIPIIGKCVAATTRHGFHSFDCSAFSIWSVQASPLTGMVAYCGEEGSTLCFQATTRFVKDPSRNRGEHFLCGSLLEEGHALIVASPLTDSLFSKRYPGMKRSGATKEQEKRVKEQRDKSLTNDEQALAICWRKEAEETKKQAPESKERNKSEVGNEDCTSEDLQDKDEEIETFPPKNVAIHRVRWNVNKGSEKWLCYGGAAGLLRCHQVD